MFVSKSTEQTYEKASEIAEEVRNGGIVCLYGNLGSGKTTLSKGIAQALGIDEFAIKSPTYTYIRQYENLYHVDLYRLEEIDELLWQELNEIFENPNNIVLIEWADRLGKKLPKKRIDIEIKYLDEGSRQIIYNSQS